MALTWEQRQAVVMEALTWQGTPYHHQAALKGQGADCTFPAQVYFDLGLIPETPVLDYSPQWHLHQKDDRYREFVARYGDLIPGPPQPGDLVLCQFGRCFSHSGIVIRWPRILHAVPRSGVQLGRGNRIVINGHPAKRYIFYSYRGRK